MPPRLFESDDFVGDGVCLLGRRAIVAGEGVSLLDVVGSVARDIPCMGGVETSVEGKISSPAGAGGISGRVGALAEDTGPYTDEDNSFSEVVLLTLFDGETDLGRGRLVASAEDDVFSLSGFTACSGDGDGLACEEFASCDGDTPLLRSLSLSTGERWLLSSSAGGRSSVKAEGLLLRDREAAAADGECHFWP